MRPHALPLLVACLAAAVGCTSPSPPPPPPASASTARPAVRVRVEAVAEAPLARGATWTGLVQSERKVRIAAELPGKVVERRVERGTAVTKGQLLIRLDDDKLQLEMRRAQAAAAAARTQAEYAAAELARGLSLGDALAASKLDQLRHADAMARDGLEQAEVAVATIERSLQDTRVTAPFAGIVADRYADVGDTAAPGMPLLSLVSVDPALVQVGVSAAEAARLSPGLQVEIVFPDLGGEVGQGTLLSVGRLPDPATGTYLAELRVPNPGGALREGMVARVSDRSEQPPALLVPRAALVEHEGAPAVFVVDDDVARVRPLRLGREDATRVEVVSGVDAGDPVVIEGQFALADGIPVVIDGS